MVLAPLTGVDPEPEERVEVDWIVDAERRTLAVPRSRAAALATVVAAEASAPRLHATIASRETGALASDAKR